MNHKKMLRIAFFFTFCFNCFLWAKPNYNQALLQIVRQMPNGGGYNASDTTIKVLESSMMISRDTAQSTIMVNPAKASPSFCSGATYMAFLQLLSLLQKHHRLVLSDEVQKLLLVSGQPDGSGVWGRWNANGPGTARLFFELGLGRSFTIEKLSEAQPGDFLKIFWTDEIGAKEQGHSVIFTGVQEKGSVLELCFWSSNKPTAENSEGGRGEKCVNVKKIRYGLFSRLEHPERLADLPAKMGIGTKSYADSYLQSMLQKSSTHQEVCEKVGC